MEKLGSRVLESSNNFFGWVFIHKWVWKVMKNYFYCFWPTWSML